MLFQSNCMCPMEPQPSVHLGFGGRIETHKNAHMVHPQTASLSIMVQEWNSLW